MNGFGGTIGKQMVLRTRGGRTYMGKMPEFDPALAPTVQQDQTRLKFRECMRYAKSLKDKPELKARYAAAAKPWQTAHNVAFADAFKAPVIADLRTTAYAGQVGDKLLVKATDDFEVANVTLAIFDASGTKLEEGPCILEDNNIDWAYVCTVTNPVIMGSRILVSASDLPGNRVALEQTL